MPDQSARFNTCMRLFSGVDGTCGSRYSASLEAKIEQCEGVSNAGCSAQDLVRARGAEEAAPPLFLLRRGHLWNVGLGFSAHAFYEPVRCADVASPSKLAIRASRPAKERAWSSLAVALNPDWCAAEKTARVPKHTSFG